VLRTLSGPRPDRSRRRRRQSPSAETERDRYIQLTAASNVRWPVCRVVFPGASPMAASRDLLFGLLALQNGLIQQGQLVGS
jgi:hypothetical protein